MTDSGRDQKANALTKGLSDTCAQCRAGGVDRLVTVEEVAHLISFSEKSIYQLVHRKVIPYTKISGALRFKKSDIAAWIEDNTFKPQAKNREKDTARTHEIRPRQGLKIRTDMDRMIEQARSKYLET